VEPPTAATATPGRGAAPARHPPVPPRNGAVAWSDCDDNGHSKLKEELVKVSAHRGWWAKAIIATLGILVGAVLGSLASLALARIDSEVNSPEAKISTPSSTTVPISFDLEGTFDNVSDSEALWFINRAQSNNRWHPQDKPCAQLNNGRFSCGKVFLGVQDESDRGAIFDIVIVRADTSAVDDFLRYDKEVVHQDPENATFPGLAKLPSGAQILDLKTVVRD